MLPNAGAPVLPGVLQGLSSNGAKSAEKTAEILDKPAGNHRKLAGHGETV
jgi:hypothetical protein